MLRQRSSERGAVLVHVAIMLLGLAALSGFVLDYGVFWVARRQAQNAADAGALAAAISLADSLYADEARNAAIQTAKLNSIWGESLPENGVVVAISGSTSPLSGDSPPFPATGCNTNDCVRVSVFRDSQGGRTNPLPTYFLKLANVTQQEVRATAVAKVSGANSTPCLMPFILADRWNDTGTVPGVYDLDDDYTPGVTGYTPLTDIPGRISLFRGEPALSKPDSYFVIGDTETLDELFVSCLPGFIGQTVNPAQEQVQEDYFGLGENLLPHLTDGRVVYIPVYNPQDYLLSEYRTLRIANIIPFVIEDAGIPEGVAGLEIAGRFLTMKGDVYSGEGAALPPPGAAFLRSVRLIR